MSSLFTRNELIDDFLSTANYNAEKAEEAVGLGVCHSLRAVRGQALISDSLHSAWHYWCEANDRMAIAMGYLLLWHVYKGKGSKGSLP